SKHPPRVTRMQSLFPKLKHGLINLVQNKQFFGHDKEDPQAHIPPVSSPTPASVKAAEPNCVTCGAYQASAYQDPIPQTQSVSQTDFESYIKANDAVLRNMQNQCQNVQNQLANLTDMLSKFMSSNTASSSGSGTLPSNTITNPKKELKGITTRSGVAYQGPTIPTPPKVVKQGTKVTKDQVEAPSSQISGPMPNVKSSIPYPLRRDNERRRDQDNEQIEKFYEIFKDMRMDECLALADLGASINLMLFSVWEALSLSELTPTCMTLELADRSVSKPIGIAKDVSFKVATRKDHFPLPFMDQMLERLAGNEFYCFPDGFSGYFQIPIDPRDQEKTTFTCPYGTFAYRRMPFGLCNAPGTFQRCMLAIFHDMVEKTMEVFMDDFSVFGNSFENYLSHLDKMLQSCEDTNLSLNWEKSHFMVKEGIVLGHKIPKNRIEVDRAKVDVIAKLPHPTTVKVPRGLQTLQITTQSKEDHEVHLKLLLELLKKEKLFAKFSMCEFWLQEVDFLGHVVNINGIHVEPSKANVVANALSWKERVKPRCVRAMTMTIQSGVKEKILAAQGDVRKVIMDEAHATRYSIHPRANKMYYDLRDMYSGQTLQKALGTRLDMSTAYHPQKDGQTLNGRKCRSPILWAEIRESRIIGPELVQETTHKVVLIKERFKVARDRQKSYADNRRIMDREVKKLKHSMILIVKVRWNSKRGPEFTLEREDIMKAKSIVFDNPVWGLNPL
nr:reverse transcriptase domain-containing protein [Tanacetum cinerariifolium]